MSTFTLALFFNMTSATFTLPPDLLSAICFVESSHRVSAMHLDDGDGTDSIGVCQVKLKTARWMGFKGTQQELLEPSTNIYYAGRYFSRLLKRYDGSISKAIIAYNIGHAGHLESTKYSRKVLRQWRGKLNEFKSL